MKLYFAPLEGIAGYVFRNAFHKAFNPKIDKYFSPFISPGVNQPLTPKELRDIHPDNNKGMRLVPQILANNADDFLLAAGYIRELGYDEVNLNLGCPSGTVVAKKKGAGLLSEPDNLQMMLRKIYDKTDLKVSLKTRIGMESPEEFENLLEIYSQFPVEELIVHPRVRSDFYNNSPNMEAFNLAVEKLPENINLCYNGDILTKENYINLIDRYENIDAVMIGRGFLRNPFLAGEILGDDEHDMEKLKTFHDLLLEGYINVMSGERPVLFKMKELWCYMGDLFPGTEKQIKKIRKAEKLSVYEEIVKNFF